MNRSGIRAGFAFATILAGANAHAFDVDGSDSTSGVVYHIGLKSGTNQIYLCDANSSTLTLLETLNASNQLAEDSTVTGSNFNDELDIVSDQTAGTYCGISMLKFDYGTHTVLTQGMTGQDTIFTGFGADTVYGDAIAGCGSSTAPSPTNSKNDVIVANYGTDTVHGCPGSDLVFLLNFAATPALNGEYGDDFFCVTNGFASNQNTDCGPGTDQIDFATSAGCTTHCANCETISYSTTCPYSIPTP